MFAFVKLNFFDKTFLNISVTYFTSSEPPSSSSYIWRRRKKGERQTVGVLATARLDWFTRRSNFRRTVHPAQTTPFGNKCIHSKLATAKHSFGVDEKRCNGKDEKQRERKEENPPGRRPRRTWGKSCRSGNIFQEPSSRPPSYKLPSGIISHTTKCSTSFPIAWLPSRRKVNPVSRSTMHVAEQVFVPVSDAELPAAGIPQELFDLGFVP